jgi:hypothetical protein
MKKLFSVLLFSLVLVPALCTTGCESKRHREARQEFEQDQDCSRLRSIVADERSGGYYREQYKNECEGRGH